MANTLIIIGSILTNKVLPGAGCRHIYAWQADPIVANLTKAQVETLSTDMKCMRTNIFIIDRFHNSTDIFVPLNCIKKKS